MKERPILFNGEMVRAILSGQKMQTRRIMKHQPGSVTPAGRPLFFEHGDTGRRVMPKCPFGQPSDRLWVRETFTLTQLNKPVYKANFCDADGVFWSSVADDPDGTKWRPSIHMPRWASRITLEITGVRIERLQDIADDDAKQEGVEPISFEKFSADERALLDYPLMENGNSYRNGFAFLWESINGPGSWAKNPWVWVIEFKRRKRSEY